MEFRLNSSLLKLWNFNKERTAHIISNGCMNAAVSKIGSITCTKPSNRTQEMSYASMNRFCCINNLQHKPKSILKQKKVLKLSMQLMTKKITREEMEEDWGGPEAFKLITFIKDNFDEVLNNNPSVLIFFSASWCPHCLRLRKPYGMAAVMSKEAKLPMKFATFDVNYNPDLADEKGVVGIPLIKYYKNGKFVSNYKGKRTALDLFNFAKTPPEPTKETKLPDI